MKCSISFLITLFFFLLFTCYLQSILCSVEGEKKVKERSVVAGKSSSKKRVDLSDSSSSKPNPLPQYLQTSFHPESKIEASFHLFFDIFDYYENHKKMHFDHIEYNDEAYFVNGVKYHPGMVTSKKKLIPITTITYPVRYVIPKEKREYSEGDEENIRKMINDLHLYHEFSLYKDLKNQPFEFPKILHVMAAEEMYITVSNQLSSFRSLKYFCSSHPIPYQSTDGTPIQKASSSSSSSHQPRARTREEEREKRSDRERKAGKEVKRSRVDHQFEERFPDLFLNIYKMIHYLHSKGFGNINLNPEMIFITVKNEIVLGSFGFMHLVRSSDENVGNFYFSPKDYTVNFIASHIVKSKREFIFENLRYDLGFDYINFALVITKLILPNGYIESIEKTYTQSLPRPIPECRSKSTQRLSLLLKTIRKALFDFSRLELQQSLLTSSIDIVEIISSLTSWLELSPKAVLKDVPLDSLQNLEIERRGFYEERQYNDKFGNKGISLDEIYAQLDLQRIAFEQYEREFKAEEVTRSRMKEGSVKRQDSQKSLNIIK